MGIGAVDDTVRQRQGAGAGDAPPQVTLQDLVVDGWKVAEDDSYGATAGSLLGVRYGRVPEQRWLAPFK